MIWSLPQFINTVLYCKKKVTFLKLLYLKEKKNKILNCEKFNHELICEKYLKVTEDSPYRSVNPITYGANERGNLRGYACQAERNH